MSVAMTKQERYDNLYMEMAERVALMSYDERRRVGCVVLLPNGMLSYGWNGMPSGMDNKCKDENGVTRKEVLHAEANALDKISRSTISTVGSTVYCTDSPCLPCALRLDGARITRLVYRRIYNDEGLQFLISRGIEVNRI